MRRSILYGSGLLILLALPIAMAAEGSGTVTLTLPAGDPVAGRAAFQALSCTSCHRVTGENDFPKPVSANPGPTLGVYLGLEGTSSIASSVFAPSHEIRSTLRGDREDELSPMGDFTEAMTVRQFLDLVAYLSSLK
jgi:mono/diheme cytochrome c family protein